MRLEPLKKEHWKQYKDLYKNSFPDNERMPLTFLRYHNWRGKMEMLEQTKQGEFAGLVITVIYKSYLLVTYLAIEESERGQGYGSQALTCIKERYPRKRIFLEIEELDPTADNYEERKRRKDFYMKNGLEASGVFVRLAGVPMELMTYHCHMTEDKYLAFYRKCLGPVLGKMAQRR